MSDHENVVKSPAEDRVQKLGSELCELLGLQLEMLDPERISNFNEAEMRQYEQRRSRITQLVRELTGINLTRRAA
jgi:hypothetical protein